MRRAPRILKNWLVFFARQGTGSFLCSILTDTEEQTERAIQAFLDWKKLPHAGADLLGIHLEGPFLSPKHKGAMPESLLRTPDYDLIARYQEKAEGHIRYITLAPELPGAIELIPKLRALGIVTALGHSDADYRTTEQAIFAGARAATHTGTRCAPLTATSRLFSVRCSPRKRSIAR